jgi:hypothetical protein
MIVTKVTVGFVTQRYDTEKKRFIDQEFHAADDVTWEDEMGNELMRGDLSLGNDEVPEPYLNFEMKSPAEINGIDQFKKGDTVLATPNKLGGDDWHEFQGTVKGFRKGNLVTVEDQEGDCFDCYPDQLESLEEKDRTSDSI